MTTIGGINPAQAYGYNTAAKASYAGAQYTAASPQNANRSQFLITGSLGTIAAAALGIFFGVKSFRKGGIVAKAFNMLLAPFKWIKNKIPFFNKGAAQTAQAATPAAASTGGNAAAATAQQLDFNI